MESIILIFNRKVCDKKLDGLDYIILDCFIVIVEVFNFIVKGIMFENSFFKLGDFDYNF